jgi:hypothetical protein
MLKVLVSASSKLAYLEPPNENIIRLFSAKYKVMEIRGIKTMVENDKSEIFIDPSANEKIVAKMIIRESQIWRKMEFLILLAFEFKGSPIFLLQNQDGIYF